MTVATIIGEGGSGGALALGVADKILMLENSVYSVITVEGCAAILWKDGKSPEMREKAAASLRITSSDLLDLKIIDEIIPEPPGGAHNDAKRAGQLVDSALEHALGLLTPMSVEERLAARYEKFRRMGRENQAFIDTTPPPAEPAQPDRPA